MMSFIIHNEHEGVEMVEHEDTDNAKETISTTNK